MKGLIWYSENIISERNLKYPGMERFSHLFKIFGFGYTIIFDRSNTIRLPFKTIDIYPLPKFRKIDKDFEAICNERAREIIEKSKILNTNIYVLYSGGIDSTLVLVSLLKHANSEEQKKIIVFLTENSIEENLSFYENHIKGKLKILPSSYYREFIGTKNILVSGENNDQLFGGNILVGYTKKYGVPMLHESFSRKNLIDFFCDSDDNIELNSFYVDIFEKLAKNAPIMLKTNLDYLWWFIFTCRFQTAALKPFSYIQVFNYGKVNREYFENYYISFFASEDFQLWSMNNLDKKIGSTWKSYKQICKDIIYKFNPDEEYRVNKIKFGSFKKVSKGNKGIDFLDENFKIQKDIDFNEYFNSDNDF